MAHFAKLDQNNTVMQVVVIHDNDILDQNGVENEEVGIAFCRQLFGLNTIWKQTSYNVNFRKNYAGIGYSYDNIRDAFIPPKPYPSWIFDEDTCNWHAPVPYPNIPASFRWDEETKNWIIVEEPAQS